MTNGITMTSAIIMMATFARTGACFCCLAIVALIFAAAPAKAGHNSIDVAVIVYDGVLTSDITAPLEVFGNAARKPWLQKINVEAVAAALDEPPIHTDPLFVALLW